VNGDAVYAVARPRFGFDRVQIEAQAFDHVDAFPLDPIQIRVLVETSGLRGLNR